jgi:two-component system response regulator PrrA
VALRRRRVCWAEDAADDQFLIRQAVGALDDAPDIAFVGDGAALVQAVSERRPDLAVLDINMPVLDGLGALRRLRAHAALRDLPAVLFSTARRDDDVAAARELRVLDFVQKPSHFDDFAAAVRRVLSWAGGGPPKAAGEARPSVPAGAGWRHAGRPALRLRK